MFKMKNIYNWYQDVSLNTFNWYQDFICFLTIGINALFTFNWYMFTFNWYQMYYFDTFFKWYLNCLSPLIVSFFLFKTKRGRTFFLFVTPLLMIDKKGENYLSLYACFVYLETYFYLLVCHLIGIKSFI